jgi:glutathione S-transferase
MKLYQYAFSPNCQKVVALAHEVGVPLELATVELFKGEAKTPAMLAKNPNGKLPILEDDDFVLWESTAMLAYIAAKAGRADLAPTTPRERAEVDRWTSWQVAHFGPAIRKVAFERIVKKLGGLGAPDEALVKAGIVEFATTASVLEQCLGTKEYLCGRLTIADFALAPYAALAETCGLDLAPYLRTKAWLGRMTARDSMKRTLAAARGAA